MCDGLVVPSSLPCSLETLRSRVRILLETYARSYNEKSKGKGVGVAALHQGCQHPQGHRRPWWIGQQPRPQIDRELQLGVPGGLGVEAADRLPRPLHRDHWHPLWVPTPSVEGLGLPIGGPDLFPFRFFVIRLK
ncbi:hypothetical protein CRG98_028999 [Punica granatum]|uniref:Uncharacterized protein n=1 Tax=Punica granatum TaxID=22663 RepID=A0A2I0J307_PUNGR|nr:hypothetical protein CRG98_028999 [Punica granatum]